VETSAREDHKAARPATTTSETFYVNTPVYTHLTETSDIRRNDASHNADVYRLGCTPRFTTAARVRFLGFWATHMSNIRDVARFGWCRLAGHRRPARSDLPGANFTLTRLVGGQMTSGLLQGSDCRHQHSDGLAMFRHDCLVTIAVHVFTD
jgi:hypothetical protein